MATYRIDVPASGGTYTAATLTGDCQITNFSTSSNTEFSDIISDWAYDPNDKIRLTAATNSSSSSRDGYMVVNYSIGGNSCSNTIHLVQSGSSTPTASGYRISVGTSGKTTPALSFCTASDTVLAGVERVSSTQILTGQWTNSGNCSVVKLVENYGGCTKITINGHAGVTILPETTFNGTTATINLPNSFNTSDYNDGSKTIWVNFD